MTKADPCAPPWKCFFCGDIFPDAVQAARHFGEPEGCEVPVPGCVDPLRRDETARLREVQLARYEARKALDERDETQERANYLHIALKDLLADIDQMSEIPQAISAAALTRARGALSSGKQT